MYRRISVIFMMLLGVSSAVELPEVSKQEIAHLFAYLEKSGCQFNRNGTLYSAEEAVAHLHKKYNYLTKKALLGSTEDFIKGAASSSSISKKPYFVKCGSLSPIESAVWFTTELERHRRAQ